MRRSGRSAAALATIAPSAKFTKPGSKRWSAVQFGRLMRCTKPGSHIMIPTFGNTIPRRVRRYACLNQRSLGNAFGNDGGFAPSIATIPVCVTAGSPTQSVQQRDFLNHPASRPSAEVTALADARAQSSSKVADAKVIVCCRWNVRNIPAKRSQRTRRAMAAPGARTRLQRGAHRFRNRIGRDIGRSSHKASKSESARQATRPEICKQKDLEALVTAPCWKDAVSRRAEDAARNLRSARRGRAKPIHCNDEIARHHHAVPLRPPPGRPTLCAHMVIVGYTVSGGILSEPDRLDVAGQ